MSSTELLKDKLNELESEVKRAERNANDGKEHALTAMNAASEAEDRAGAAKDAADSADDEFANVLSNIGDIEALIAELRAMLSDAEGDDPKSTGLHADMVRWGDRVKHANRAGLNVQAIAEKFEISEFLVQHILAAQKAA